MLVCVLASTVVMAAEGRIPIFEAVKLDGSLGNINGNYIVTRNIDLTAGPGLLQVIEVVGTGTETVEIDLNGFRLTGDPMETGYTIDARNLRNLILRNGALGSSVSAPGCLKISGVNRVIVEDVLVECGRTGIAVNGAAWLTLKRNTVITGGGGIVVTGESEMQGTIQDNQVDAGGPMGSSGSIDVDLVTTGLKVLGNQIDGGGGSGIRLDKARGALIADNSVRESAGAGILLTNSSGCRIHDNSVVAGLNVGIQLIGTHDSLLLNNISRNNGGHGIDLINSTRNHIDRNVTNVNGGGQFGPSWGLHFNSGSSGNSYGRNSASGNLGSPQFCPASPNSACGAPELCDEGMNNKSFGDNLVPGPPVC